jgi:hypothetical protein
MKGHASMRDKDIDKDIITHMHENAGGSDMHRGYAVEVDADSR